MYSNLILCFIFISVLSFSMATNENSSDTNTVTEFNSDEANNKTIGLEDNSTEVSLNTLTRMNSTESFNDYGSSDDGSSYDGSSTDGNSGDGSSSDGSSSDGSSDYKTPQTDKPVSRATFENLFKDRNHIWPTILTMYVFFMTLAAGIVWCISKHRDIKLEKRQKKELEQIRAKSGKQNQKIKLNSKTMKSLDQRELKIGIDLNDNRSPSQESVRSDVV